MDERGQIVRAITGTLTQGCRTQKQLARRVAAFSLQLHGPEFFGCRSVQEVADRFGFGLSSLYREMIDIGMLWEKPATANTDEQKRRRESA